MVKEVVCTANKKLFLGGPTSPRPSQYQSSHRTPPRATAKIGNLVSMAPKHAPSKVASLPWEIVVSNALKSGATTLPDIKKAVQAQQKQLPSGWEKVLLVQLKKVGQSTASRTTTCCESVAAFSRTIVDRSVSMSMGRFYCFCTHA